MQTIVERIGKITRYMTRDYPGGIKIVDIDRSASPESCSPSKQTDAQDTA